MEDIVDLKGVKFQLALKVHLRKDKSDGSEEFTDPVLRHKQEAVLKAHEIDGALDKETLEKWTQRVSGWVVDRVETLWLDIALYQPLRSGSYIPLPTTLKNKKAVVNVKNKDDHCLRWALFPAAKDPQRPTKYPTDDGLNFTGVDAPLPISQIEQVERQNNLALNVFGWDKGVIVHRLSKQHEDIPRINLLLIEKGGRVVSSTTSGSRISTACSMTRASTENASTSARGVCMGTHKRTCWRRISRNAKALGKRQ